MTKKRVFAHLFVWTMVLLTYLPILYIIAMSFTESRSLLGWDGFSLGLYPRLFRNEEIMRVLGNTMLIALISSLLATLIGTISAVGIHAMRKLPKAVMNGLNQITVVNAEIVTAAAFMIFFWKIVTPITGAYYVRSLSYIILILCHTVITTPFVILNVMPKLSQLDANTYEAALDLGASPNRALWRVMIPQLVPGMISGFVIAFTLSLDDFIVTQYNKDYGVAVETISTYVYNKARVKGVPPEIRALSALLFVVILAVLITVNVVNSRRMRKKGDRV